MTKKQLLKKITELYNEVDEACTNAKEHLEHLKTIRSNIEDLPTEDDPIEDDDEAEEKE